MLEANESGNTIEARALQGSALNGKTEFERLALEKPCAVLLANDTTQPDLGPRATPGDARAAGHQIPALRLAKAWFVPGHV